MKSDTTSVPEQLSAHREKRSLNPWLLVFGAGFGFLLLVVVGLSLLAMLAPKQGLRANEVLMPDGKVLRIEGVTWGRNHRLNYEYSPSGAWAVWDRRHMPLAHGYGQDQLMVWMTCHDARSRRSLDFEWWSGSVVVDSLGQELHDSNPYQWQTGPRGNSSGGGSHPLRADRSSYDDWVVASSFPAFRTDRGSFKLQVKNVSGEVVATFELTHPSPPAAQTWEAETLPTTKTEGDVSVTLNRLPANFHWQTNNGVKQKYWYYSPDTTVSENGQSTNEWEVTLMDVSDPLGNHQLQYFQYGKPISLREPAWKVGLVATRRQTSKFTATETWTLKRLPLPGKDTAVPLTDSQSIGGVTVTLAALAGSGKATYSLATPGIAKFGNFSSSSGGGAFDSLTKVETKRNGSIATSTVEANWPHLTLEAAGLSQLHRLFLLAKDDQGRDVPTQKVYHYGELQSYFFKTELDAKSLTLSIIVHKGHLFEFFVKPPELPEDSPMP